MNDVEFVAALAEHTKAAHRTQEEKHAAELKAMCDDFAAQIEQLTKQVGAIPVVTLEAVAAEPGPQGPSGPAGQHGEKGEAGDVGARGVDGRDGRDGKDGIASRDEVRAETAKAVGELRAELLIEVKKAAAEEIAALPTMQHKGVWKDGEYVAGSCVSWAGSTWHAVSKTAEKPGDGATAWVLIAKRGNPGKDAR